MRADTDAIAVDQIKHARGEPRSIYGFSKDHRVEGRFFGRLQHHGTAGDCGSGHLEADLVHWPVPRRDQCANPNRFIQDSGPGSMVAQRPVELKGLCSFEEICNMRGTGGDLFVVCHINGGAHLKADGLCQLGTTLVILNQ